MNKNKYHLLNIYTDRSDNSDDDINDNNDNKNNNKNDNNNDNNDNNDNNNDNDNNNNDNNNDNKNDNNNNDNNNNYYNDNDNYNISIKKDKYILKKQNHKKILCNNYILNNNCHHGLKCSYAHGLNEQNIEPYRKNTYDILNSNSDLSYINFKKYQYKNLMKDLLTLTKLCDMCINGNCTGGYNCKYGSCTEKYLICYDDLNYSYCNNINCNKIHL